MFIPTTETAHDTSYFMSRYVWNPEDENVHGGSDFDDLTDSYSGSSSSFSNLHDEEVILFPFLSFVQVSVKYDNYITRI